MRVPFVGQTYESQSPDVASERTVNWYPEVSDVANGKASVMLYPTPGYTLFATLPQANVRALGAFDGRVFAVAGTGFYEVSSTGVVTLRGTVATTTAPASMCTNGDGGDQLFVTDGAGNGYILTLSTNVFASVTFPGTLKADIGDFIDGYFVALDTATSTLMVSDLLDGTTWDALMIAQRSTAADPWVGMVVSDRQIHLFGEVTTESWYNSGNADFPFSPVQGSLIRDGISAPHSSVALIDNTRIWLSANAEGAGVVKRAAGYQPTRISTHAVEHAIQNYAVTSDAEAWAYQEEGHTFYVMSFPTMRATWVYDATTQLWHERGWWNTVTMRYEAVRGRCHAYSFGQHLVGDRESGGIYTQSITTYTDIGGVAIRRLRQGPHICAQSQWMTFPLVRVLMETGVGTLACPNPQAMMQWSDDGGHTWSNEHWVTMGFVGAYGTNAVWRRCGRSRDRVFRLVVSDPVPARVFGMEIENAA